MTLEIATRWGETLLDVAHVERGDFTLGDRVLVHAGVLVGAPAGKVGHVDYEIREIDRPARSVPYARTDDRRVLPYLAAALLAHVGVWALATTTSPPAPAVQASPRPRLVVRIAASPSQATVPDDRSRDRRDTKSQGEGQAAHGDAGLAGTRSPKLRGHIAVKNTGEVTQLSKADAVARARRAGILGQTQVLEETIANLAGSEQLTSAFDNVTVNAATGGAGDAAGTFGMAMTRGGTGGGGTGWGTIGTGSYGSYSSGNSAGHGWGGSIAPARASWPSWQGGDYHYTPMHRRFPPPHLTICPIGATCTVEGDLGKAVVRRYVMRERTKLEYCFEKELLANPKLAGDVTVFFEARGDGSVGDVITNGVDPKVAACVQGVFYALTLPRGSALVTYTLRYKPSYMPSSTPRIP